MVSIRMEEYGWFLALEGILSIGCINNVLSTIIATILFWIMLENVT